jgi:hypothetical protein
MNTLFNWKKRVSYVHRLCRSRILSHIVQRPVHPSTYFGAGLCERLHLRRELFPGLAGRVPCLPLVQPYPPAAEGQEVSPPPRYEDLPTVPYLNVLSKEKVREVKISSNDRYTWVRVQGIFLDIKEIPSWILLKAFCRQLSPKYKNFMQILEGAANHMQHLLFSFFITSELILMVQQSL